MKNIAKLIILLSIGIGITSCTGSGSSGSGGNSNNIDTKSEVVAGNISTIPTGTNATDTSFVVTNNLGNPIVLKSATYTVFNAGKTPTAISASSANSVVDMSQCSTIASHNQCNVMVKAPDGVLDGQYLVKMVFNDIKENKEIEVNQIVSYSSVVPTTEEGVRYSAINNAVQLAVGNSTTIAVPFVLAKSFGHLSATSRYDNPAFSPTISCPGGEYTQGNICTLYVKINISGSNDLVAGYITVTDTAPKSKAAAKAISLKGATGYVMGFPITVNQTTSGNLVTSATNVVVNPSDGSSAQTVTLLNNGNATISGIAITPATPAVISSNTCTGSLAANATCTFDVNVTSTVSGQTSAVVTYNTGATSGDTTGNLSFNVIYIAPSSSISMSMTSGQGSLVNTAVSSTSYFNIIVKNTSSSVEFSNITFSTLSVAGMSYDTSSTCALNGTQTLDAGNSCTLVVKYSPTAVVLPNSFTIRAVADYLNSGNQQETYSNASIAVSYSAITGSAFLYITPNYTSFAIKIDGNDSATQTFRVMNGGLQGTTVDTIGLSSAVADYSINETGTTCTAGSTSLLAGESCVIVTKYGPKTSGSSVVSNLASKLQVAYLPSSGSSSVTAFADLIFNAVQAAFVNISNVAVTGTGVTGSGISGTPYQFTNSPTTGTQINFAITYNNTGSASATNFNVALNGLPVGYVVNTGGTTCGYGSTVTTLSAGSTCTVAFKAVDSAGLYNPYNLSGPLNVNLPGFSYTDTNTGLNKQTAPIWSGNYGDANTVYVTANKLATVTTSTPTWTIGSTNSYTFTGTNGTIITIPSTSNPSNPIPTKQLDGFTVGSGGTCTISGGSCSISITSPSAMPAKTYYFSYLVSPSGSPTEGIIQQGGFTLQP